MASELHPGAIAALTQAGSVENAVELQVRKIGGQGLQEGIWVGSHW
jgi:hypothetical protein